jgi:hypothetical protein
MDEFLSTLRQSYALSPEEVEIVDDSAKLPMSSYMRHACKAKDRSTPITDKQRYCRSNTNMDEFLSSLRQSYALSPEEIEIVDDSAKLLFSSYMLQAHKKARNCKLSAEAKTHPLSPAPASSNSQDARPRCCSDLVQAQVHQLQCLSQLVKNDQEVPPYGHLHVTLELYTLHIHTCKWRSLHWTDMYMSLWAFTLYGYVKVTEGLILYGHIQFTEWFYTIRICTGH